MPGGLLKGRYMFSGQLQGIAEILDGLGEDVWACVELETSSEQRIMRELSRLGTWNHRSQCCGAQEREGLMSLSKRQHAAGSASAETR
jgi:hypothetical protein